jgi:hypothetical protein
LLDAAWSVYAAGDGVKASTPIPKTSEDAPKGCVANVEKRIISHLQPLNRKRKVIKQWTLCPDRLFDPSQHDLSYEQYEAVRELPRVPPRPHPPETGSDSASARTSTSSPADALGGRLEAVTAVGRKTANPDAVLGEEVCE